jgi:hypothetical protein
MYKHTKLLHKSSRSNLLSAALFLLEKLWIPFLYTASRSSYMILFENEYRRIKYSRSAADKGLRALISHKERRDIFNRKYLAGNNIEVCCHKGCNDCCSSMLIPFDKKTDLPLILGIFIRAGADGIETAKKLYTETRQIRDRAKTEEATLEEWNQQMRCPFICDEGCMIYPYRPETCMNWYTRKKCFSDWPPDQPHFNPGKDYELCDHMDAEFARELKSEMKGNQRLLKQGKALVEEMAQQPQGWIESLSFLCVFLKANDIDPENLCEGAHQVWDDRLQASYMAAHPEIKGSSSAGDIWSRKGLEYQ